MRLRTLLPRLLLTLLLTLPSLTQAQFTFTTNNGTITITRYIGPGGDVIIPDTTNGLPVTGVGPSAFAYCFNLTNVTIPDSITTIGQAAFFDCTNLASVTLPSSVRYIGEGPFSCCTGLADIEVDAGNTNFSSADGVVFDKHRTIILQYPCGRGGSYTVPNTVTNIGGGAFTYAVILANVEIPETVTSISENAFYGCYSLNTVNIPGSVSNIGFQAFCLCEALTNAVIADGVKAFGESAFQSCGLMYVIIPASINSIGTHAFSYCLNLTSISIPGSVTSIGYGAFAGCSGLTNAIISDGVRAIGDYAFNYCRSLTSVSIPSSVTTIGASAFQGVGMTSFTIPCGVTSIGGGAFATCPNLTNLIVSASVNTIGASAFGYSTNLTSVYFLGNAPSADLDLFFKDYKTTVYYLPGTTGWGSTLGGRPTASWFLPNPLILSSPNFGVRTNAFGFVVSWATNLSVVVDACVDLANAAWSPVSTNALMDGWFYFSDPDWTNYPARLYRIRSP